jgi:hypothetical protein
MPACAEPASTAQARAAMGRISLLGTNSLSWD